MSSIYLPGPLRSTHSFMLSCMRHLSMVPDYGTLKKNYKLLSKMPKGQVPCSSFILGFKQSLQFIYDPTVLTCVLVPIVTATNYCKFCDLKPHKFITVLKIRNLKWDSLSKNHGVERVHPFWKLWSQCTSLPFLSPKGYPHALVHDSWSIFNANNIGLSPSEIFLSLFLFCISLPLLNTFVIIFGPIQII